MKNITFTRPFQGACAQCAFDGKLYVIEEHGGSGSYWYVVTVREDRKPYKKEFEHYEDVVAFLGQDVKRERHGYQVFVDVYGLEWYMTREREKFVLREVKKVHELSAMFYTFQEALDEAKAIVRMEMEKKEAEQLTIFDF